jgi:hypothetical protein
MGACTHRHAHVTHARVHTLAHARAHTQARTHRYADEKLHFRHQRIEEDWQLNPGTTLTHTHARTHARMHAHTNRHTRAPHSHTCTHACASAGRIGERACVCLGLWVCGAEFLTQYPAAKACARSSVAADRTPKKCWQ